MGEIADALKQAGRSDRARESSRVSKPKLDREYSQIFNEPDSREPVSAPPVVKEPVPDEPAIDSRKRAVLHKEDDRGGDHRSPARVGVDEPFGNATQQYRRVAFRLRDLADSRSVRSIVVTSAQPGDGKTTTSCNIAMQLVRLDQNLRVVLVDLDLRRATIAAALGIKLDVGIDAVLRGEAAIGDAVVETDVAGLSILGLQHSASDPEWLLAQPTLGSMIRELENRFDFVIIDSPPVLAVSDAQLILRHAAAGIFVARAGVTRVKSVRQALAHLPTNKMLGSFLNANPGSPQQGEYVYYSYSDKPEGADGLGGSPSPVKDHADVQ